MDISKIIFGAVLTTVAWAAFGFASRELVRMRVPQANVVRGVHQTINGHRVEIADPTKEEMARADLSLPFMTSETFSSELEAYGRKRTWAAGLTACFALATIWFGSRLGGNPFYGIGCLVFGPLAVSYVVHRNIHQT